MKIIHKSKLLPLLLLLIATAPAGAETFMVESITDTRSTQKFFTECKISIIVMGSVVSRSLGIRSARISYAVDDTGLIISKKDPDEKETSQFREGRSDKMTASVSLKNPDRSAKTIQIIKGEVELFHPDADNGGIAEIPDFLALKPGQSLSHPALSQWNISIQAMTRETYEIHKKRELENAKKSPDFEKMGEELGAAFGQALEGMFSGMMGDDKNSLYFIIKDPQHKLVDLRFRDATGKEIDTNWSTSMGEIRSYGFKTPPARTMKLIAYLAAPKAVSLIPFELKDIPLP